MLNNRLQNLNTKKEISIPKKETKATSILQDISIPKQTHPKSKQPKFFAVLGSSCCQWVLPQWGGQPKLIRCSGTFLAPSGHFWDFHGDSRHFVSTRKLETTKNQKHSHFSEGALPTLIILLTVATFGFRTPQIQTFGLNRNRWVKI